MLDFSGVNQIYSHPGQPQMQVEIILASRSPEPNAPVIYTIRLRYPRILHGEIMTHRVFSRNARSSRAVPVRTMLLETTSIPFIPWHWGANQKGMQATEECNETIVWHTPAGGVWREATREQAWLEARDKAVEIAENFMNAGYHKQNVNRLLEPFSWIDTLITSTDWDNFLWLRDHKDAEPHLQDLARLVKKAINNAVVQDLSIGEWHLPYITMDDRLWAYGEFGGHAGVMNEVLGAMNKVLGALRKISSARCARISYKPFDGDATYERELERYDQLVTSERVHASPLEHQACPDNASTYRKQVKVFESREPRLDRWETVSEGNSFANEDLSGNLGGGWIQARKLVPNEAHRG